MFKFIIVLSVFWSTPLWAKVIAKVGNMSITLKEFRSEYKRAKKAVSHLSFAPTPEQFLEDMIRFKMGLQEAKRQKVENIPQVKLKMQQELYKALLEVKLAKKVESIRIKKSEVLDFYKHFPNIRTSHILIRFPANTTPAQVSEAKTRANKIYSEVIKSKRPFYELVQLYSDDDLTKPVGGDLGFQSIINLHPNYYKISKILKPGQTGGPVRTRYGFHIIRLTGIQKFKNANKNQIRIAIFDEKRKTIVDSYLRSLKKKYKISVNKKLIK